MTSYRDYIIKRVLTSVPTLFGISVIVFTIIHLAPGGPLAFYLEMRGSGANPAEMYEFMKQKLGLDQPIYVQYILWMKDLLTGSLGTSYISAIPISDLIGSFWLNTLKLSISAIIFSALISVPFGVIAAVKKDSIFDNASRVIALLGVSMPSFWTGLILIYIFSVWLDLFPVFGAQTIGGYGSSGVFESLYDQLRHLALPLLLATFNQTALLTRLVRSSMLEVLNQEYIMTARAKGVRERMVIYKHALRNALLPVVTVIGLSIGFILSGSVIIETIFAWPGLGRFIVQSTFFRDYPAIMAMTMMVASLVILSTIITDIVYGMLDPRIRY